MNNSLFLLSDTFRKLKKSIRLLQDPLFRRALAHGVGAAIEHQRALSSLPIRTVVDIGANVGQFSLLARSLYPSATIYAFEPQADAARSFAKLFVGDERTILFQSAVGSRGGQAQLHVSRQHDSSSLLPISATMTDIFPGTEEVGVIDIQIARLSSCVSVDKIVPPALLKIDVQGAELEVLSGCEDMLDEFHYILIELSFIELYRGQALCDEVIRYLDQHQFVLAGVHNLREGENGRTIQADFLFRRADIAR